MIKKITYSILFLYLFCTSCVKDRDYDALKTDCADLTTNISFQELENLIQDNILHIQENLILEGYIVSSDIEGNFFSSIHIQDKPQNPTKGIKFETDLRDYHLLYKTGGKVFLKLKGLYLAKKKDALVIGGSFSSFGNISVGRLPSLQVKEHLFLACNSETVTATKTTIPNLNDEFLNTLIHLENIEIIAEELHLSFAESKKETERTLIDCNGTKIKLLNSGYSDFQSKKLPQKNGSIIGVLGKDRTNYYIKIRSLTDLNFNIERCPVIITEFTSTNIFISEIADPNNNSGARFIELYNSSSENINLNGWKLNRYTNASTKISSTIDLSAHTILSKNTLVISPNANEFFAVYGFSPDVSATTNSPADSNGDDNLELVDPFGMVIDVFGVIGQDGSNTNHEFEDGKAVRKPDISIAKNSYDFNDWIIFNDSGMAETTNLPQNAPQDFSPGNR